MLAFHSQIVNGVIGVSFAISATIITLGGMPNVATADFDVAATTRVEKRPAVASNPKTGEFMAAYLRNESHPLDPNKFELRVRLFDSKGIPQGDEIAPFGIATHNAIGRPDIAYSPNSNIFYVVVAERLSDRDRVLGRPLDANGKLLPVPGKFFDDTMKRLYEEEGSTGASALRVTHNSLLDEFVVTFQRTYRDLPLSPDAFISEVVAQRVDNGGFHVGGAVILHDAGHTGFASHALAHAPVTSQPMGGHYLFAVGPWGQKDILQLLDKDLKPKVSTIPFDTGQPKGKSAQSDIAFGRVEGKERFLVVWSDGNNCKWPLKTCPDIWDVRYGVWGSYLDPNKVSYGPGPNNTPFRISDIASNLPLPNVYMPRVDYSATLKSFFVVWREYPFNNTFNDESRTHIRGNRVDYLVPDGLTSAPPKPHKNTVVSDVTGKCPPQVTPPIPDTCPSLQDPGYPDVAAIDGLSAAVVWEQNDSTDIRGDIFSLSK